MSYRHCKSRYFKPGVPARRWGPPWIIAPSLASNAAKRSDSAPLTPLGPLLILSQTASYIVPQVGTKHRTEDISPTCSAQASSPTKTSYRSGQMSPISPGVMDVVRRRKVD
ncbi:hypothetical protein PENTCL1PPCAC_9997 [Pristionchus entomophagus]|uniref:Uncharacterized protein n=1 Tax=Pristionchus entomophagus TaxID=358040 RepID=A0AAV5SWV8_9BILA|nr:hypothetical protein PENTCL1PPCAC_9997 [Pristionchus entomophagus]